MTARPIDEAQHSADAWELAARKMEGRADKLAPHSPASAAICRDMAAELRSRAPVAAPLIDERSIGRTQGVNRVLAWLQARGLEWLTVEYLRETRATPADEAPVCETCDGHGVLSRLMPAHEHGGGYWTEPCPDCTPPADEQKERP